MSLQWQIEPLFARIAPILDGDELSSDPWYSTDSLLSGSAPRLSATIGDKDTPEMTAPLYADQRDDNKRKRAASKLALKSDQLKVRFTLYVAAQTADERNGANQVFTGRSRIDWALDATGNVNPDAGYPFPWTQTGAGVTNDDAWSEVTDGTRPVTSRPVANDYVKDPRYLWVPYNPRR